MKQLVLLIAVTLIAAPAFAQDDGDGGGGGVFGGFGGFDSDNTDEDAFNNEAFGNPAGEAPRIDILADLRNWLAKAKAPPLDKKQEKPLNKLYDKEVKAMSKSFEKKFGVPLESAIAAQNPVRGRRGARTAPMSAAMTTEIRRLSEQLMNKIIAALRLDQQGALRTYQSEELRVRRLDQFIRSMEQAGLSLTPEQRVEVEALYAREGRLRTLIIVEARGEPHQVRVSQLEAQTTQRALALLNESQKTALAEVMAKSKGSPGPLSRKEGVSLP
jgi:hypothetical protein